MKIVIKFWVLLSLLSMLVGGMYVFYVYKRLPHISAKSAKSCVPFDIKVHVISQSSVEVTWKTIDECYGFVRVGDVADSLNIEFYDTVNNVTTQQHSVEVTNITEAFYMVIISDNIVYGIDGLPIFVKDGVMH